MNLEHKTVKFEVKEIDEEAGVFTGYAATFSDRPDSYGDIIDKGAFKKTLKEAGNRVKILWNHFVLEPIGKPLELAEDEKGLLVKGKLTLGVQRAREVLSLMKDGVITEMSIGYDTMKEQWKDGTRHLQEVRLWDVSPCTFAANPEALITSVKAELKPYPNEHACRLRDPDDFEEGSFRRTTRTSDGKKYSVIMGKLDGEDTLTEQAYRYNKDIWEEDEAKIHCKDHDGNFEPAEKQNEVDIQKIAKDLFSLQKRESLKAEEEKTGRVLSASNIDKVRSALNALQALLEAAENEPEPEKSTLLMEANKEATELEQIVTTLKAENEGFDTREAEARITKILDQLKEGK